MLILALNQCAGRCRATRNVRRWRQHVRHHLFLSDGRDSRCAIVPALSLWTRPHFAPLSRAGILVLVNGADWELEGGAESAVKNDDEVRCPLPSLHFCFLPLSSVAFLFPIILILCLIR